jgi:hypothetical protein
MSLIKKSDVKNHLLTRSGSTTVRAGAEHADENHAAEGTEIETKPLHLIGEEPVANAQVGGSVGVPDSPPWRPRKL